jgi:predicted RNase H-like HicB family nuclease
MKDYHINIFYSDEDEGYIADIPDLEACSSFGVCQGSCRVSEFHS